jgi:IclR family acetate operon transcriptional repressor
VPDIDGEARTSSTVQSLARAFDLLERLADAGGELPLSDLAERCRMPMPTAHRLAQTLVRLGYARQDTSRRYVLGPRLIRLGDTASHKLGAWAEPHLADLVELTGETANLAVLDGDGVLYVAQVPSPHSMRMFTEVGRRVQPHCTGVGKAILSQLPEDAVVDLLVRTGMPKVTDRTITSIAAFLREMSLTQARGYAIDDGEQELGVRCIAMALRRSPTPAAVSVSGPESRMLPLATDLVISRMSSIAEQLSSALGAPGPDEARRRPTTPG